jgi:hypothetical protein
MYLGDTGRSPDFCSAAVELDVDGVTIRAAASGPVSKYDGEGGANAMVAEMLERLVLAVRDRAPPPEALHYAPLGPTASLRQRAERASYPGR